jgi:hypothetical protein
MAARAMIAAYPGDVQSHEEHNQESDDDQGDLDPTWHVAEFTRHSVYVKP